MRQNGQRNSRQTNSGPTPARTALLARIARRTCCESLEARVLLSTVDPAVYVVNPGLTPLGLPTDVAASSPAPTASRAAKPTVKSTTASLLAAGYGLQAQYYTGASFDTLASTQINPTISYNWGLKAPVSGMTAGPFAVRWTGTFTAPRTGKYTFYTAAQGGAELLIDGSPLIDRSTASGKVITRANGKLTLTAGQTYAIEVDYFATGKRASMALRWAGPRIVPQLVPTLDLQSGVPQPVAPDTLTATPISAAEIDLAWSAVAGAAGYVVLRSTDGVSFTTIANVDGGTTVYNDTGLSATSAFQYRVLTTNLLGTSGAAAGASATTLPLGPNAPTSLAATALVGTNVNLVWADASGDATAYMLQRSVNGGAFATIKTVAAGTLSYVDTTAPEAAVLQYRVFALNQSIPSATAPTASATTVLGAPVALSNNLAVNGVSLIWLDTSAAATGYVVQRSTNGGAYATLTTLAPTASTYFDSSITGGNTYQYQVVATTAATQSVPSNAVTVAPLAGVPSTPANLVATPVSDTEVNLTWDRVGTGETSLTLYRSTSGGPYQLLSVQPAGSDIWTDTSCYPNTTYSYKITADNANGSSTPTAGISATTQASGATLASATGFAATAVSPFEVDLSWTDNVSGADTWLIERSTNGISFTIVQAIAGNGGGSTTTYVDTPVSPGTSYYYRTRTMTGPDLGYSDYTPIAVATTATLAAGVPLVPVNVTSTVNSATSTTLNWSDTNGGNVPYDVQISPYYWTVSQAQWTDLGTTGNGATSYTLSTSPETAYYARIRAVGQGGDSAFTAPVIFRTASAGTGSPQVYTIGPGQEYTSLGALNWSSLGPGDTVEIFPNKDSSGNIIPYYEKPLISVRGTATAPITIEGMPDPVTGQQPIIDGTNAVTSSQWDSAYLPLEDLSLVLIGETTEEFARSNGWSPGFFSLQNLEIRNGYSGDPGSASNTYTASDGTTRSYSSGSACGIYLEEGDHITIKGCSIHDNNEGIFGAGGGSQRNLEHLLIESNTIYGNGTIGSYYFHNVYLEAADTVYQYNTFGELRAGSYGVDIKDRSAGAIIRYNYFEGSGTLLMVVQTENYFDTVVTDPTYHDSFVYGNVLYSIGAAGGNAPIFYGGDATASPEDRKGIMYFYNNTVVNIADQSNEYHFTVFDLSSSSESLDARNNIIADIAQTTGAQTPLMDLLPTYGNAYFGTNWISPGAFVSSAYWNSSTPETGGVAGLQNSVDNPSNDPGFISTSYITPDFYLTSVSQVISLNQPLAANEPPVMDEYAGPSGGIPIQAARDLGAYQYASWSPITG